MKTRLLFILVSLTAVSLNAQTTLYWNGANVSADPAAGGTGTWSTTNAWRSGSASGSQATWAAATGGTNIAVLEGAAGTITLGTSGTGNFTGSNMFVNTSGYTITSTSGSRNLVFTGTLTLAANAALTFNMNNTGSIWGFGNLSLGAGSTFTIQGGASAANANRLNLTTSSGSSSGGSIILAGSGAGATGFVAGASGVALSSNILNNSTSSATLLGAGSGNSLTYSGILSGSANLQISAGPSGGAGTVILSGANDFTGNTYLNTAANGVLRLGITNALPSSTTIYFAQNANGGPADSGGTLDLNGFNQSLGGLDGAGRGVVNTSVATATLTIGKDSGTNTFSGVIGVPAVITNIPGANNGIAVNKTGGSTQILLGANTYSGGTTVSGGTLTAAHNSALGSGSVSVTGGTLALNNGISIGNAINIGTSGTLSGTGTATLTGSITGTGTLAGVLTLGSGADLNAGNSPGSIDNTGTLTFAEGSTLTWELAALSTSDAGTNFDQIVNTGIINLSGGSLSLSLGSFAPSADPFWSSNRAWSVIYSTGGGTITGTALGISTSQLSWSHLGTFSTGISGQDMMLTWTAIPEPSTYAAIFGALALAGVMIHRRRKQA